MRNEINKLNNEIAILKSIVKDQDAKIAKLEAENQKLKMRLIDTKE